MNKIKLEIPYDFSIPYGWGIAYLDWKNQIAVCYPYPLNFIVRFLYYAYWGTQSFNQRELDIYNLGFQDGIDIGKRKDAR